MTIGPNLTVVSGSKISQTERRSSKVPPSQTFTSLLGEKMDSIPSSRDVVEVISLENRRAKMETPPRDLAAAEQILQQITRDLGVATKADLRNVHKLEGLVHYYVP